MGEAGPGLSTPFCIVSGACSGRYAAWYAREAPPVQLKDEDLKWVAKKNLEAAKFLSSKPSKVGDPRDIQKDIKETMWNYVGTLRNDAELNRGAARAGPYYTNWLKNVLLKGSTEGMHLFTRPVQLTWEKP